MMSSKAFTRLPVSVVPYHYSIKLKPDLEKHTFTGTTTVQLDVKEPVRSITCNANELVIKSASINTGSTTLAPGISLNTPEETLTLSLGQELAPGKATVTYEFTGILNDKMRGFYRSKYTVDGQDRFAAVTQFEATDARQAFPCWDEPAVKATFDMTIIGPKDRVILSNMPEIKSKVDPDDETCKVVSFATTPIMSTYLVAIVVGEFDFIEGKSEEGVTVRVYSPLGKKEQGSFALECGIRSLTFYSKFFNVPYPLAKYDMIAIPDFNGGAMENWGLVTYRESCILVDPLNTSESSKQWVAIVVCHETAHQWFGNLVTMEWWTHLWLNEGFASFMENLTTDILYPEYRIWDQFVPNILIEALMLDSLDSSHPIEVNVGHPSEVDEIFDTISYNKGASVIRMLHDWIGDEAFKNGMKTYLTKYAYKNTETNQLWAELESASAKPVTNVMKTWTEQMGFPCISMTSQQEGSNRLLKLTQSRFVADGRELGDDGPKWEIPVSIKTSSCKEVTKIMMNKEMKETILTLPNVSETDWVKLNPGMVGFYRVNYSAPELTMLCEAVKTKSLSPVDRLNILDDLFSLISAGKARTSDGLKLLESYKDEDSYIVWNSISQALSILSVVISDQDFFSQFDEFILEIFSGIKKSVKWDPVEGESHLDNLLRALVITRLGKAGDQLTREEAKRRFSAHAGGGAQISPDIRSAVYRCVASMGQEDDYNTMLRMHEEEELHEEKERLAISGLAAFKSKSLLSKTLEFSLSSSVRSQDSVHMIGSVAQNRLGRDLAWQFYKDNFDLLKDRYQAGFLLSHLVKSCTENFNCEERAAEVENFFACHPLPGSERNVAQAVETIRLSVAWLSRDAQDIADFFKQK